MRKEVVLTIRNEGPGESVYNTLPSVPGSRTIFVGPAVCTKHGLGTANELDIIGKVSYLLCGPNEMASGQFEDKLLRACGELMKTDHPECLSILMMCQNAVMMTNYQAIERRIEEELGIPAKIMEVCRIYSNCDPKRPVMNYTHQEFIYRFIEERRLGGAPTVNMIGTRFRPDDHNDIFDLFRQYGIQVNHMSYCGSLEEFKRLGGASLNILYRRNAEPAGISLQKRLGMPWLPLRDYFNFEKIAQEYRAVFSFFGKAPDLQSRLDPCRARKERLVKRLGCAEVVIDGRLMQNPRELAIELLKCGVRVRNIQISELTWDEEPEQGWLKQYPEVKVEKILPAFGKAQMKLGKPQVLKVPKRFIQQMGFTRWNMEMDDLEAQLEEVGL